MASDPRFEIPPALRSMGIFGGLLMMALGLIIGWRRSGMDAVLPPTGGKPAPKEPDMLERLAELITSKKDKT
jgi:hypothetical protein